MSILITGHRGYIGSSLVKRLEKDNDIILFDGDVTNLDDWKKNISIDVETLYHLAAAEPLESSFRTDWCSGVTINDEWEVNCQSLLHMQEACVSKNIFPKIIFSSSTNVFGSTIENKTKETTTEVVSSIWSAHKLLAENYLRVFKEKYNIKYVVLMLPSIYGPSTDIDRTDRMTMNRVIKNAIKSKEVQIYDNKNCLRDFLYIDDALNAFELLLTLPDSSFDGSRFALGLNEEKSIKSFCEEIVKQIPNSILKENHKKLKSFDYRNYISDITKFNSITNWSPEVSHKQGIRKTIGAYYEKGAYYEN